MIVDQQRVDAAINLLKDLIQTESFSRGEQQTADRIEAFLNEQNINGVQRIGQNIIARNKYWDIAKPVLLLNSHHDTVKPNSGWTLDPFQPVVKDGKLFGLGSNDAGGALVSLISCFLHFYERPDLPWNIMLIASAEEEISGDGSIRSVLPEVENIDLAIVGEPTQMQMAIAEKGLMVLRCRAHGVSGHAARNVGENAILKALPDIQWFSDYRFPNESSLLGPVKMSVTLIEAGVQHNVIPDRCDFTVDIRTTDAYSHDQIENTIRENIGSEIVRCTKRLNPSSIRGDHPLVRSAQKMNIPQFASETLSDQSQIDAPSVKMGPGVSERSHTADEFILLSEIEHGIETYITLIEHLFDEMTTKMSFRSMAGESPNLRGDSSS